MDAPTYRFRLSQFSKETTCRLTEQARAWSEGAPDARSPFRYPPDP
jgi:hypothetical protein